MTELEKEIKQDDSLAPENDDKDENLEKNEDEVSENLEVSDKDETPPASEEGDNGTPEKPEIDYKAELKKAQKQLNQAEHTIVKTKKENKELKEKDDWEEPDIDSVKEELKSEFNQELNNFKNSFVEDTVEEQLENISNPDEKELVKFYYNNKLVKTGYSKRAILDDLQTARAMANRQRLEKENNELKRTLVNKQGISNDGVNSSVKKEYADPDVKLTAEEKKTIDSINRRRASKGLKPLKAKDIISGNIDFNN